jgi:hypothetical protein
MHEILHIFVILMQLYYDAFTIVLQLFSIILELCSNLIKVYNFCYSTLSFHPNWVVIFAPYYYWRVGQNTHLD